MIVDDDKAYMSFSYSDVGGKTTSISVPLSWDTNWVGLIDHVALALEGAGFGGVRQGIQVRNFDHYIDKEEPEFIPLIKAMER